MISELSGYLNHCRDVVRDIDYVLADHELQTKEGWTIHYAADFSEIFGFTHPFKNRQAASLASSWQDDPLRQYHGITRFFHRKNIVLLEPYVLELHAHMEELMGKYYDDSAGLLLLALKDLENLVEKNTDELLTLRRFESQKDLSHKEAEQVIRIYEEQAPAMVAYVRGVKLPPLAKLKRLLAMRPFVDLDKIAPRSLEHVSDANVRLLTAFFTEQRHHTERTTDRNDALAIEQVRAANRDLQRKNELLLLVSRGPLMFRAMDIYQSQLHIDHPFVRHPRIFSPAYQPEGGLNEAAVADLKLRRESLRLFIDAAAKALERGPKNGVSDDGAPTAFDSEKVRLTKSLEVIKTQWSNAEGLSTAFAEEGERDLVSESSTDDETQEVARQLLDYLRDRSGNLRVLALRHIRQVFAEVRLERDLLSAKIESAATDPQLGNILYVIEFNDPELRRQIEKLAQTWSVSVDEAATLVETAAESDDEYEQRLAMAVSLGIIGRWRTSENYAAYALNAGKPAGDEASPKRSLHEGRFWHAICVRKNTEKNERVAQSVKRIERAIKEIDIAIEERRKALGDVPDPRYLKEQAALMIEWRQITLRNPALLVHAPLPGRIEEKLATALEATNDPKLIVQIRNAACYLYFNEDNLSQARESLNLLREALAPYTRIPSYIRDTILWGQFKLTQATAELNEIERIRDDFDQIRESADLTPFEKELVQHHRNEVTEWLRNKKYPV